MQAIRNRMRQFMQTQLKWTHRELHDALLAAGLSIPAKPSLVNYFTTLRLQFGDAQTGFLPQSYQSHTKKRIQDILRILARNGLRIGGKLADKKSVLTKRIKI